jgi:hypothetical protein
LCPRVLEQVGRAIRDAARAAEICSRYWPAGRASSFGQLDHREVLVSQAAPVGFMAVSTSATGGLVGLE